MLLVILSLIVMLPILLMRFSYNSVSFDDDESRTFGVNPSFMRVYGICAGGILTTAAMIHCGNAGTIALIVPHMCRYAFGADFRKVIKTSIFYGGFLLMASSYITKFLWIGDYQVPVSSVVSLLAIPVMIIFSLQQKRGWE